MVTHHLVPNEHFGISHHQEGSLQIMDGIHTTNTPTRPTQSPFRDKQKEGILLASVQRSAAMHEESLPALA